MTIDPGNEGVPPGPSFDGIVKRHQPTQRANGRIVCRTCQTEFPCRVNKAATRGLVRVMGLG